MKTSSMKSQLLVLFAAILWGTTGSAQAFAPIEASPMVIGALRMAIGGITLLLVARFRGSFKIDFELNRKYLIIASLSVAAYQPLFFLGVSKTGIALGTILALGSAPVFAGTMEYIAGEKLNLGWIIGTSVSIMGCILLFSGQGTMDMDILGSLLSLGAGLSYALYVRFSQDLFQNSPRDAINGMVFSIAAILLVPLLFIYDLNWVLSPRGIISTLHLGLIATALAYTLFAYGLVGITTPEATTLTLAEPLTATLLGIIAFNERLSPISTFGIIILFCGLIINSKTPHK